jgi:hypothetical protein
MQNIFEISQSISVQNHRTVGQQVSRSGQMRVAQYLTAVPWVFTVKPHNFLYYPQARQILNELEVLDRQISQPVSFISKNLQWFTSYQGSMTLLQSAGLLLASLPPANSTVITIKGLPTISQYSFLFRAGDFIMVGDYPYKVTQDVYRGVASTVQVYINRPIIYSSALIVDSTIVVGNDVFFTLYMETFPTYTLMPMTNGAFIQWDSDFVFREAVGYFS